MVSVRDRMTSTVMDPATAEQRKPWYPSWCERPTSRNEYLEVFNEPPVDLLDTDSKGPSRATEPGLLVAGKKGLAKRIGNHGATSNNCPRIVEALSAVGVYREVSEEEQRKLRHRLSLRWIHSVV